jgi:adenosylcobyric acid synthase
MVQGTSSWAGKSLLVTALARLAARRGIAVAPFKAQNMSNNARVVDGGGEIGVAQWLQARAARVEPDVRMNPVLVKPEGAARSQVVVLGRPDLELSRRAWRERPPSLWPVIEKSLRSLAREYDLLLLEGAGSPAEINLQSTDLSNMRVAHLAGARVVLVTDIERGGAFAHLFGTWSLLDRDDRGRLCGFVLNKFRGDASLLAPGPELLRRRTGVPVIGVVPRIEHGLPDEDGAAPARAAGGRPRVAIVRYPTASNLDEFKALEQVADVAWATSPAALGGADLVVLPGSKHVASDLGWLRARGGGGGGGPGAAPARAGCSASAAGCRCSASASRTGQAWTGARPAWGCLPFGRPSRPRRRRGRRARGSAPSASPGHRWAGSRSTATRSVMAPRSPSTARLCLVTTSGSPRGRCSASTCTGCSSSRGS